MEAQDFSFFTNESSLYAQREEQQDPGWAVKESQADTATIEKEVVLTLKT